jgi:hypothetical protein
MSSGMEEGIVTNLLVKYFVLPAAGFAVAIWKTRGPYRIAVLCILCFVTGWATGWISSDMTFRNFFQMARACFDNYQARTGKVFSAAHRRPPPPLELSWAASLKLQSYNVACATVWDCGPKCFDWADATGKNRNVSASKRDHGICYARPTKPHSSVSPTQDEEEFQQSIACMRERGWLLIDTYCPDER